jgi:hypothetical protein
MLDGQKIGFVGSVGAFYPVLRSSLSSVMMIIFFMVRIAVIRIRVGETVVFARVVKTSIWIWEHTLEVKRFLTMSIFGGTIRAAPPTKAVQITLELPRITARSVLVL